MTDTKYNITLLAWLALAGLPTAAPALEVFSGTKVKAATPAEGPRDLGMNGADDTQAASIDVGPFAHLQWSEHFATYLRLQGFASTGEVVQNEADQPVSSDGYVALREAWVEYGGITTFPGEVLRMGLQRVREPSGLWWDRDIESVRWIFDTTLVQAQIAAAQQFSTYRSDDIELPPSQTDRPYLIGELTKQWTPGNYVGMRGVYAHDYNGSPPIGSTPDASTKMQQRRYAWFSVMTHNAFFDPRRAPALAYWAELSTLVGTRKSTQVDETSGTVNDHDSRDVAALAGDVGLRARLPLIVPVQLGGAYAFAQGGKEGDWSHAYVQTGLQSNRSRYTGTRTMLNRFNEALQADLANLHAMSVFLSLLREPFDGSLVFHHFERDDRDSSISTDGLDVVPTTRGRDIGDGVDFVLTRFFGDLSVRDATEEDLKSNLRLRASLFQPGSAYGSAVDDQYRVVLEATVWF